MSLAKVENRGSHAVGDAVGFVAGFFDRAPDVVRSEEQFANLGT